MKKLLLAILLIFSLVLCSACTSEQLGYRRYPYITIHTSAFGKPMHLRLPIDSNKYIYHSYDCENTESGIDMIVHFTKKGGT